MINYIFVMKVRFFVAKVMVSSWEKVLTLAIMMPLIIMKKSITLNPRTRRNKV